MRLSLKRQLSGGHSWQILKCQIENKDARCSYKKTKYQKWSLVTDMSPILYYGQNFCHGMPTEPQLLANILAVATDRAITQMRLNSSRKKLTESMDLFVTQETRWMPGSQEYPEVDLDPGPPAW